MSENMDPNYVDASTLDDLSVKPEPSFDSGLNYGAPTNPVPATPQPVNGPTSESELEKPVGIGSWVGMILLGMIPCVSIIMMFVWAFSGSFKKSQSNYAKAMLIVEGAIIVLYIAVVVWLATSGIIDELSYLF